jgi:hypothetical protein
MRNVRLRSRNAKATIVGLIGTGLSGAWRGYSAVTTAEQVPKDLHNVSHLLADPGFWPWVFIVGFLLLLGWSLWPTDERPKPEGGVTNQATFGSNSPNFSGNQFHGPVTIGGSQPEQPKQSGYSWKNFDHLTRLMSRRSDAAFPDMPLTEVVERLREQPSPPQDMDQAIRDAVVLRHLSTWGRRPGKSISKVWMDAWENGKFSHEKSKVRYRHPDNPRGEHVWSNIQFNRAEVDKWLPPKPEYEIIVI